ncbi:hypothetical protein Q3F77_13280 [Enterococcus faecium]|nr:hypothetical protein [Enterococcus faecium]
MLSDKILGSNVTSLIKISISSLIHLIQLTVTESGILFIPDSDVAIIDERDLEIFEVPEALEDSKTICFWTSGGIRNYFSIADDKAVWFDNVPSESATVFEGNIKLKVLSLLVRL